MSAQPATPPSRSVTLARAGELWRANFFAMGSPCEVLVDTDDRVTAADLGARAAAEAWRIEDKFSRYRSGNIIDRINSAGGAPVTVDAETARLLDFAAGLHAGSGGRFDITSGALRRVWTFDGSERIPARAAVDAVLADVGWERARWTPPVLVMPKGMQVDFGGIGKEYAVDQACACLRRVSGEPCLVNFGGDLAVTGPPRRRAAWQVGIESLQGGPKPLTSRLIRLESGALATSGDTRRFLRRSKLRLGHILDPTTGWPVVGAPACVTVAADTCVQAGVFATFAMLEGRDAEVFLQEERVRHWITRH
jgi:thiamine biosynthesis lipoprotein